MLSQVGIIGPVHYLLNHLLLHARMTFPKSVLLSRIKDCTVSDVLPKGCWDCSNNKVHQASIQTSSTSHTSILNTCMINACEMTTCHHNVGILKHLWFEHSGNPKTWKMVCSFLGQRPGVLVVVSVKIKVKKAIMWEIRNLYHDNRMGTAQHCPWATGSMPLYASVSTLLCFSGEQPNKAMNR